MTAVAFLALAGCQGPEDGAQAPVGAQESQAQACVSRFNGIQSCATGNAQLAATDEGLQVRGLTNARTDGVSSRFSNASGWQQTARMTLGAGQGQFSLAARDSDQVVSSLSVTPDATGTQLSIAPSFTVTPGGSSYRVNVYRDGVFQGGGTHEPAARVVIFTDWFGNVYMAWGFADIDFRHLPFPFAVRENAAPQAETGACTWRMNLKGKTFTTEVDGQQLTGDTLELVEEIGDGAYPYRHFSGIDVKGSAGGYVIVNEATARADGAQAR
ncbi:hypothetical protein JYK02_17975 [Corallococcus macrosporus]|uniref:Lipoprotein n=1 Tax=Corallococcus macrosporus TaxID=35 RepID=A0ABS3DCM6_9BACT|nr:hypothetical protein [Corallococcus macrosporus]MBN8229401.1 hypothetical protein [Corallococcus macrosporus]